TSIFILKECSLCFEHTTGVRVTSISSISTHTFDPPLITNQISRSLIIISLPFFHTILPPPSLCLLLSLYQVIAQNFFGMWYYNFMDTETEDQPQQALFDTSGEKYNINFVDQNQPLFIPNNPLHWKAHKLQILLARLDKQSTSNPAQFNSRTYIDTLAAYEEAIEKIKQRALNENMESGSVDRVGNGSSAKVHGDIEPISMGS
ncbi:hypothetical protein, partial [uncultured Kiloniella sp.]|uniref:hypothetical protein n=1 Tax=uncultured Kiloniella sp. TaxID=1133091 RepID=UPI0026275104